MSLLSKIKKTIFGYDIFISYSRRDSLDYAYAIAQHFMEKGYECYIDQLSSVMPGEELPSNIKDAVKRSTAFVLIGSKYAKISEPIENEIQLFLDNSKNRPLIPVTINGAINDSARWYKRIFGLALIDDTAENLNSGAPAEDVLDRIENALKFTRKSTKLRNITFIILAAITTVSALAAFYSYAKNKEAIEANALKEIANAARDTALGQKILADKAKSEADALRKNADIARSIALRDKDAAERLADSARHEAEKSGLIAKGNYMINLSNNLPNKYFAFDTALAAIKLNPTPVAENNLVQLFLNYPFVYGNELHNLDVPNKLLGRKGPMVFYLDGSIKQHDITKSSKDDVVKQKLSGYPNIVKDSIILMFRDKEIIKYVVHASSNTVSVNKINFDPPVYLSTNLLNNRIIHEQGNFGKPIDSTIEITEYNGKSTHLVTFPLALDRNDKIENRKILFFNDNYYLAAELAATDEDVRKREVRILLFTLTRDFKYREKNTISIDRVLFPNYNFIDLNEVVRYADEGDTLLLLFFNKKICRYSLTENRERNGIEVSQDNFVEDKFFIPGKNVMVIKNGPHLIVQYLADLEKSDLFSMQSYAVTLPENEFSFLVAGNYVLILTRLGHFYVIDIRINPNVPNNYLPVDEILEVRTKSNEEFLQFIQSN